MAIDFPASPSTNDTHTHNGLTWTFDGTTWKINTTVQSGSTTFTGLTDTPSSYTGQGGSFVKVNSATNALEFGTGGGGLQNIVEDLSPQLGAKLYSNDFNIDFTDNSGACFGGFSSSYSDRLFIYHDPNNVNGNVSFIDDASYNGLYVMYGTQTDSFGNYVSKILFKQRTGNGIPAYDLKIWNSGVQPRNILDKDGQAGTAGQVLSATGLSGVDGLDWIDPSSGGASVTTSDTPPSSPSDGDLWWDSQNGRLLVYYEDANSSQWVDASGRGVNSGVTDGDKGDITVSNAGTNSENWAIDNNTIGTDELSASGTTDATTYLRGDNTWQTISSGPSFSTSNWSLPL